MARHWIDDTDCDAPDLRYRLVEGTDPWSRIPDVEYSDFTLPGRIGAVATRDPKIGPGAYVMCWLCDGDTVEETDAIRDEVLTLVSPAPGVPIVLRREFTGGPREAVAQLRTTSVNQVGTRLLLTAGFEVPSARWRAVESVRAVVPAGGERVLTELVGGSAPIPDPLLTLTGSGGGTSVTVTDVTTGAWVSLVGDVPSGREVTIDVAAMTARAGSTTFDAFLDFSGRPFAISPPARVRVTGSSEVAIVARKAWW